MTRIIIGLFVLLSYLNILDFIITKYLIKLYGYDVEVNPFMHYLLVTSDNVYILLIVKLIVLLLFGILRATAEKSKIFTEQNTTIILILLNAIYAGVVFYSLTLI